MLKCNRAFSHAVSLATEGLWISQVNYTLGITISMFNNRTFYFIGYLLVLVFWEMEKRNGAVNGRIEVCVCCLLDSHPKHWVPGSIMLLADVTHFEAFFQGVVPKILTVSQPFRRGVVLFTSERCGQALPHLQPAVFTTREERIIKGWRMPRVSFVPVV